jgi:acyl carrier protein
MAAGYVGPGATASSALPVIATTLAGPDLQVYVTTAVDDIPNPITPASQLPRSAEAVAEPAAGPEPPDLPLLLRRSWQTTLGVDGLEDDTDVFDLGANSFTALEVAAELSERLGQEVGIGELLEGRTVAGMAEQLTALIADDSTVRTTPTA